MKKRVVFSLVVLILLFGIWFYLLFNPFDLITYSSNKTQDQLNGKYTELYSVYKPNQQQLENGDMFKISQGDVVNINVKGVDYSFKLLEMNLSDNSVEFAINNYLFFKLRDSIQKKLDLDSDEYYDLAINLDSFTQKEATVSFKVINEKKNVADNIDSSFQGVLNSLDANYRVQRTLLILLLTIIIIFLIFYISRNYITPTLKYKKMMDRQKPTDALDYLFDEYDLAKKSNKEHKAKKILARIKHMYKHLSDDLKPRYRSRIKTLK